MTVSWGLRPFMDMPTHDVLVLGLGAVLMYASFRCIYNIYFHPASRYPGPPLAAVSNVWYAYHWLTGKYPWVVAEALRKYGDVVRVAPNELAFITPQAFLDIYNSYSGGQEHFPKTNFLQFGFGDDGISFETDPAKHHAEAKRLAPAFSPKALRAKEPTMHKYTDAFVQKMRDEGAAEGGVDLKTVTDWLAMDVSAELAYSRELHQLRDGRNAPFLDELWTTNLFVTVNRVLKRFPLLAPAKWLFVPPSLLASYRRTLRLNRAALDARLARGGGNPEHEHHLDHFEQLVPAGAPRPGARERAHVEVVTGHLVIAGYEPVASQIFCTLMFALMEPGCLDLLAQEIRDAFPRYDDIAAAALAPLPLLTAALTETLRLTALQSSGQPRVSPGRSVDGHYVAKGVEVQYGFLAFTRSARYFHDAHAYRPQRWLPRGHPRWDPAFAGDATAAFHPFSLGPRACPGAPLAWQQTRIFVAKVLWAFDLDMVAPPGGEPPVVFERDFRMFGMWRKPSFFVRFRPVRRGE